MLQDIRRTFPRLRTRVARPLARASSLLIPIAACLSTFSPQLAPAESPALGEVLKRAGSYLATYQRELGTIIAEEDYWQEVTESLRSFAHLAPSVRRQTRRLRSDFLFVQLPGETEVWVGFRDVFEVDGRRLHDRRERFRQVVDEMPTRAVDAWRRLHEESARWNLGTIKRDINVPTFALEVLRPDVQPRFQFRSRGGQRVAGERVWVIEYVERSRPRLIRNPEGLDLVTHGRLWIAPESGRIVRTELLAEDEERRLELSIMVDYRLDRRLELLVPVLMREQYDGLGHPSIQGRARYSDFRRFEVDARIIGNGPM